ncbi:GNAT family N-acetyltransferase [Brachybacterium sp. J153]|uniref:GNAT family N-acetyltransferase n=1 Tax=Brachybacterium sp. J153 TaxID=3116488 RepID=UPI002E78298B|nr:GNAT family N-acetyltransferase [Brachybacterium sp. J153]MEE1618296.1 GNAT family N-acetyltransferase [Brachybacterium sp. J153]
MLSIVRADFEDAALARFLQDHLDDMRSTAPPESRHAFDLSALDRPEVRLWCARLDAELVGTAALARIDAAHEELKSMRTAPHRRGQGIARALLRVVVDDARSRGVRRLSLETGSMEFFAGARALYRSEGFTPCDPFAHYSPDPNSIFLTRAL